MKSVDETSRGTEAVRGPLGVASDGLFLRLPAAAVGVVFSLLLGAVVWLRMTPRFMTNDDVGMMLASAGVARAVAPSEFLIFSNIWIGRALKALYGMAPDVPWYGLYMAAVLCAAHAVVLTLALRNRRPLTAVLLFGLYALLVGVHALLNFQFTLTGGFAALAGLLLLLPAPSTAGPAGADTGRRRPWMSRLLGGALLVLGSMIRWEGLLLALAAYGPAFAWACVRAGRRRALVAVGVLAGTLLVAWCARCADGWAYARTPGWENEKAFTELRLRILDDRILERGGTESLASALKAAHWSTNDYQLFMAWGFSDPAIFNVASLRRAIDALPATAVLDRSGRNMFAVVRAWRSPWAAACLLVVAAALLLRGGRDLSVVVLLNVAAIAVALVGIAALLRPPPDRVYLPLLISAPWLAMAFPCRPEARRWRLGRAGLALVVAGLIALAARYAMASYRWQCREYRTAQSSLKRTIESLQPSPERLFVVWGSALPLRNIHPFGALSWLKPFNMYGVAGGQTTPDARRMLERFGEGNVLDALVDSPTIRLICRDPVVLDYYREFMKEHRGCDVEVREVADARDFCVYKVISLAAPIP